MENEVLKNKYASAKRRIVHNTNIIIAIVISGNSTAYLVLLYRILSLVLKPFDLMLSLLDRRFFSNTNQLPALVFVVGSHRSGATFVSQVISRSFPFYSVGNFNSLFPRSTYIIHRFIKQKMYNCRNNRYKNYYGQSPGLFEIGDAHEVWDQWYGNDHDTIPAGLTNDIKKDMLDYFSRLHSAVGSTIITKSGRNSLNIVQLSNIFENCFFIVVDRKIEDIVLSTLKASKVFRSNEKGWGLQVNNLSNNNLSQIDTAVTQCINVRNKINSQLEQIEHNKYIVIDYNSFCNSAASQLALIKRAVEDSHKEKYLIKECINPEFSASKYKGDKKLISAVHQTVQKFSYMIDE